MIGVTSGTASRGRRGFTLAEMLVVVGIILLVMALALPAFTVIASSRSAESARNVVASSLVRARGEAIRRGQPCGVFFYIDPDSGRSGVAIVTLDPLTDIDPYNEYMPFYRGTTVSPPSLPTPTRDYQGGTLNPLTSELNEPAMRADRVVVLGADGDATTPNPDYTGNYSAFNGRPIIVITEKSREPPGLVDPGDTTNEPGLVGNSDNPSSYETIYWSPSVLGGLGTLELVSGIDPVLLSPGAAVQVVLGQTLENLSPPPAGDGAYPANDPEFGYKYSIRGPGTSDPDDDAFIERYASAGLILFDAEGHLIQSQYRIDRESRLGRVMGLETVRDLNGGQIDEYIQEETVLGVVIYEKDAFESAVRATGRAIGRVASLPRWRTPSQRRFNVPDTEGDLRFFTRTAGGHRTFKARRWRGTLATTNTPRSDGWTPTRSR